MADIFKSNRGLIFILIILIGIYAHQMIGDKIVITLLYGWYVAIILLNMIGAFLFLYAVRVLVTRWKMQVAQARIALAEAAKASRDIRPFDKGVQVYHFGIDENETAHALHLNPSPYSNGIYKAPTQQQLEVYSQYNQTFNQQNNYYGQEEPDNPIPLLESNSDWLDDIVEKSPHLHICGPSTSGKTTLGRYVIERMSKHKTEFYLINPKRVHYYNQWPVEPTCDDIDTALDTLQHLVHMLQKRVRDTSYNPTTSNKIVIIVDDWDWVYEHYKNDALSLMMRLLKVGAELNYKIVLVGQSSLAKKTGIDTSAGLGMARIALWGEGEKLLNGLPLSVKDKIRLKEQLRRIKEAPDQIRYGVVIPMNDKPEVKVIPNLITDNRLLLSSPKIEVEIDEKEAEIINILENGGSLRKAARCLTGKEQYQINSSDTNKVKFIARKHNISV